MTVFIDLQKYKKDPRQFLFNIAWKDNIENSFFVDYNNNKIIPLKDAPEWVMNNLYLLNLDKIKIRDLNQGPDDFTEYVNVNPIGILQKQVPSTKYVDGFIRTVGAIDRFQPFYNNLKTIIFRLRNFEVN